MRVSSLEMTPKSTEWSGNYEKDPVSSLEMTSKSTEWSGNYEKRVISSLEKGPKCHSTGERLEKGSFLA